MLDFEPLFLMPDQASEGAKEPEASSVEEKGVSPPNPGSRWWERGEAVRMLPVKTDFSSLHKKGKPISLNSVFICNTKPLQKCLSKLPEFIPLIRTLPYSSPEEVRQKNETKVKLQTLFDQGKNELKRKVDFTPRGTVRCTSAFCFAADKGLLFKVLALNSPSRSCFPIVFFK